jgi:nicotinamide phosphoribosyltransferase
LLNKYALETTGTTDGVQWQGHDFSMRGMSSLQSACSSGAGHLLSFTGSDTVPAISFLEEFYNADVEKELIGASIPATEHSVACMSSNINQYSQVEEEFDESINQWKIIRYF